MKPQFWFYVLAVVGSLVCGQPILLYAQDASSQWPPSVTQITGTVVDEEGKPLAGMYVQAVPRVQGRLLNPVWGLGEVPDGLLAARSDASGRFEVAVPYEGVAYQVGVRDPSNRSLVPRDRYVIAHEGDEAMRVVVRHHSHFERVVTARLVDRDCAVLANQPVRMVGESGFVGEGRTDDAGLVTLRGAWQKSYGHPDVLIESGGLVALSPGPEGPGRDPVTREVVMVPSASMQGLLVAADTGEPIAGAEVVATMHGPWTGDWRIKTDEDGHFKMSGLPPGEYAYRAVSASHSDRARDGGSIYSRSVMLKPANNHLVEGFWMHPVATLRGRVVDQQGNPVAGAMVGCRSRELIWYDNIEVVYSGDDGRFELACGYFKEQDHPLMAYYPDKGIGEVALGTVAPGETRDVGDVVLNGATRVSGVVQDREGNPMQGVGCFYREKYEAQVLIRTDTQGRYDLGWVPIARATRFSDDTMEVSFFLDRVKIQRFDELPEASDAGSCVVNVRKQVNPRVGADVRVDARLQRTDRLDFYGQAVDEKGDPIERARVYLLPGQVFEKTAAQSERIATFMAYRDARELFNHQPIRGDFAPYDANEIELPEGKQIPRDLSVTHTDKQGRWGLSCLRADSDASLVRLGRFWTLQRVDEKTPPRTDLEWVTVLIAWGEKDDVQYRLSDPVQVRADRSQYKLE